MTKSLLKTITCLLLAVSISGCVVGAAVGALGGVAISAVSAVGGVLAERAFNLVDAKKVSLPTDMEHALASVQKALRMMNFEVELLQPTKDGGYIALFGNQKSDGSIALLQETDALTTFKVKVLEANHLSRREEVEEAVTNLVRNISRELPADTRFDFNGYNNIRSAPNRTSPRIGWFRIGSKLQVSPSLTAGWLKITMPEGEKGFLKGRIE
ncbi:MAG: SH3 domain-containing protein [Mariprofundales bacterium]|nr:SH3 domain-containing protein [Mariprofundales bacterium]